MLYRSRAQYRHNYRDYRERSQCGQIIGLILEEEILEECKITEVKILEENIEVVSGKIYSGRGRSRSRERQYPGNFRRNNRCSSRKDQVLGQIPIDIELDVF